MIIYPHSLQQKGGIELEHDVSALAVDSRGWVYCAGNSTVTVLTNNLVKLQLGIVRIKIYSPARTLKSFVATPNDFTDDTKGLDLAVDSPAEL